MSRKIFPWPVTAALVAATLLFVPLTAAWALDLEGLDDVTMQVIDSDEDLTKAIPRVIALPPHPEGITRSGSRHAPLARNRDANELPPAALDQPSVATQPPPVPPPVVAPDVPELSLPGDDIHMPFLQPPDTLIPLPIPDIPADKAMAP